MLTFHITPAIKPKENTDTMVFGADCANGHQTCQTHPRTPHSASFSQEHCATTSDERQQSNVCRHWDGTSAGRGISPTQNQHQSQTCVQHGEQRNTKPSCSRELSPRVPGALETGVRDLALQTKTNMDHWRPTRWLRNHRERMLKLSLSLVAAPHRPRPCPTEIRRTETHPSTRTEKKNAAGIIRCIIILNKITTT